MPAPNTNVAERREARLAYGLDLPSARAYTDLARTERRTFDNWMALFAHYAPSGSSSAAQATQQASDQQTSPQAIVEAPVTIVAATEPSPPVMQSLLGYFDSESQVVRKMNNTICKYKGEWVFVECPDIYDSSGKLYITKLEDYEEVYATKPNGYSYLNPNSPKKLFQRYRDTYWQDFEFPKTNLGYLNTDVDIAHYLAKVKNGNGGLLGLSVSSISAGTGKNLSYEKDKVKLIGSKNFREMIEGIYPTHQEVWSKISTKAIDHPMLIAFSPKLAVGRKSLNLVTLHYQTEQVGELVLKEGATLNDLEVYPSHEHLVKYIKAFADLDVKIAAL